MQFSIRILFFLIFPVLACTSIQKKNWINLIPAESSYVIVPNTGVNVTNIGNLEYASVLDDITPSSINQLSSFSDSVLNALDLKALVLHPSSSVTSEFIWICETKKNLSDFATNYYQPFEQNYYSFNGLTIHKIHFNNTLIFATQVHEWIVFSHSSLAIESTLRAYLGMSNTLPLATEPSPGQLISNTGDLDQWAKQFITVALRPTISGATNGLEPSYLEFIPKPSTSSDFHLTGIIDIVDSLKSSLVENISSENRAIILDKYIASNSAAFAIFRKSASITPYNSTSKPSKLDNLLLQDQDLYRKLALSLDQETAVVSFPESGLLSNGEYLFLRKLENLLTFQNTIDRLAKEGYISKQGNSYYIKSTILAKLISSDLAPFIDFYLSFSQDVAVLSNRRGLSESVDADRVRRRTIYYNNTFRSIKNKQNDEVSGFVWVQSEDFLKFMNPMLIPSNTLAGLIGNYDILTINFYKNTDHSVTLNFNSVSIEGSTQPYDERWVLPLQLEDLTGSPTLGNIIGSPSDEIIIATSSGRVEALAYDGTSVMQAFTNEGDIPIGSPILYDWYGNGQPVILQAAGSKIYAWNEVGRLLPQFPIEIGERISAPIVVSDVSRNGIPEIIVATENRKIHVVDGRGQNLRGWPQFTSAIVTHTPLHTRVDGEFSIWVVSQNILHSWQKTGAVRPGYPTFVNASFNSTPIVYDNKILGVGSDGNLYSIGTSLDFSDNLSLSVQSDSLSIKSLYATSSQLNDISVYENVLLRDSTRFYRSDLYITQSINGSILMFNPSGELKVSHNLGQPTSNTFTPQILDINGDNKAEIIALADFGRLFAWEVLTGRRVFNIPTSGMKYPIIEDINGDGSYELIAQTREGLRCWTINKPEN